MQLNGKTAIMTGTTTRKTIVLKISCLSCDVRLLAAMLLFAVLLTNGCSRSAPKDLIEEDRYIDILAELHVLAGLREIHGDSLYITGRQAIHNRYQITPDQFERSHRYYQRDMAEQQRRFREVRNRLEEANRELSDYYEKMEEMSNDAPHPEADLPLLPEP
ncbi:MAG: DUF4296 domain-containing protein [Balneolales bacterium]